MTPLHESISETEGGMLSDKWVLAMGTFHSGGVTASSLLSACQEHHPEQSFAS